MRLGKRIQMHINVQSSKCGEGKAIVELHAVGRMV